MGDKVYHDTGYDANRKDTKCWATCSCKAHGPVLNGSMTNSKNIEEMEKWISWHQRMNEQ